MLFEYFEKYQNKKIGFVGCGVSNLPILRLAASYGIRTVVRDKKKLSEDVDKELQALGAERKYGDRYLDDISESILFLSPGVRSDLPQLIKASMSGVKITTEMSEFFDLCPCPIFAVTGSDGKTTTTTIISKLLTEAGYNVYLGGNIGINLFCELDNIKKTDYAVVELSSFQLMKMHTSPRCAVVTNISPNHLDWHTDMDEYIRAKMNICRYQRRGDSLVLNFDDPHTTKFVHASAAKCVFTSAHHRIRSGVYYSDGYIWRDGKMLMPRSTIILPGVHNVANYCEAIAAVGKLVTDEQIIKVASTFGGVEHRCELVRVKDGVRYYNSSIDSSPSRTSACLRAFDGKVICICGGYDKKIPFEPLAEVCIEKAKKVILTGATADRIQEAFDKAGFKDYVRADDLESATKLAESIAEDGDVVVLSPACASFDAFRNFAERGEIFKKIVNSL